jgi:hypothetical protein
MRRGSRARLRLPVLPIRQQAGKMFGSKPPTCRKNAMQLSRKPPASRSFGITHCQATCGLFLPYENHLHRP